MSRIHCKSLVIQPALYSFFFFFRNIWQQVQKKFIYFERNMKKKESKFKKFSWKDSLNLCISAWILSFWVLLAELMYVHAQFANLQWIIFKPTIRFTFLIPNFQFLQISVRNWLELRCTDVMTLLCLQQHWMVICKHFMCRYYNFVIVAKKKNLIPTNR